MTVRGQFGPLDEETRTRLLAEAEAHDHMHARFTKDGTFTYDAKLQAFSFRFEVRVNDDEDPEVVASERANAYLAQHQIPRNDWWRVVGSDMAEMWRSSRNGPRAS